jgi:hypothetical protein
MKSLLVLFTLVYIFGASGCAIQPQCEVSVNSINNGISSINKICYIGSGMEKVSIDDLKFKEYSTYLKRSLESRGYKITDSLDNAEVIILLRYGISEPQTNIASIPVFGQTGISSSMTYGTIHSHGSGYSSFSGTTYHTPTYGITGYKPISYMTYTRYAKITAYDRQQYKQDKKEVMLWETDIVSTGSSGDLRHVFPIMIAAATPYIGENTGKSIRVSLTESSNQVKFIKGLPTK